MLSRLTTLHESSAAEKCDPRIAKENPNFRIKEAMNLDILEVIIKR